MPRRHVHRAFTQLPLGAEVPAEVGQGLAAEPHIDRGILHVENDRQLQELMENARSKKENMVELSARSLWQAYEHLKEMIRIKRDVYAHLCEFDAQMRQDHVDPDIRDQYHYWSNKHDLADYDVDLARCAVEQVNKLMEYMNLELIHLAQSQEAQSRYVDEDQDLTPKILRP